MIGGVALEQLRHSQPLLQPLFLSTSSPPSLLAGISLAQDFQRVAECFLLGLVRAESIGLKNVSKLCCLHLQDGWSSRVEALSAVQLHVSPHVLRPLLLFAVV